MNRIKYILASLVLILSSCSNSTENSELHNKAEQTYEEAIQIHDDIMPKMGKIEKIKVDLKEYKADNQEDTAQVNALIIQLDEASQLMRMWMHSLKVYPQEIEEDAMKGHHHNSKADTSYQIHLKQKEEIITIQASINNSIEEADLFLKH